MLRLYLLLACTGLLAACDSEPPTPRSIADIEQLPIAQKFIGVRFLPEDEIPALSRLRNLEDLDFGEGCDAHAALTDRGLASVARLDLPNLHMLNLFCCANITNAGLIYVASLDTVRELVLGGCFQVTDDGLPNLLGMRHLTYLDLRGDPGITDRGLQMLTKMKHLKWIILRGCPNVTDAGIAALKRALPDLKIDKNDEYWSYDIKGIDPSVFVPSPIKSSS
jgi:hypothetical protein